MTDPGRATSNRVPRYIRIWTGSAAGASSRDVPNVFWDWWTLPEKKAES